jgi:hypothetical protein
LKPFIFTSVSPGILVFFDGKVLPWLIALSRAFILRLVLGEVPPTLFLFCVAPDGVFLVASLAALALSRAALPRAIAAALGFFVVGV